MVQKCQPVVYYIYEQHIYIWGRPGSYLQDLNSTGPPVPVFYLLKGVTQMDISNFDFYTAKILAIMNGAHVRMRCG